MLKVKGDSRAALGAIGKMRSPSPALNAVVRELALDLAQSSFQLGVWKHVAGVDNKVPDFLSKRSEPGAQLHQGRDEERQLVEDMGRV